MDALLNPAFGSVVWATVSFLVVLLLLRKMAWGPILQGLKDREEEIEGALNAAKEARAEIQNLQSDNERLLQEARAERDGMLRDARDMADKLVADAKQTAKDEGERMIDQAKQAIDGERAAAVAELKAEVAKLSLEIAEKLVRQELKDDGAQQELIGRMISDSKLN
ncbi:MAG: F0F1 ATP synthase subunit B [Bacteroidota bacterium]|jgi:F-type H+-transporting ATPase subunit b|nr:F0F1 ATP synthase subunit B [Bacteroidota bacterium]MEC8757938.1 F0F1 ATP synthase subunit B [Bacteroidota bacterium]